MQYQWCVEECDDVAALHREISWHELTANQELLTTYYTTVGIFLAASV